MIMKSMKRNVILLLGTVIILCSLPHASFAQTANAGTPAFKALATYPNTSQFSTIFSSTSLSDYINAIFKVALSVGAILAVLRIAYGGYMYMGSADMWGNMKAAREIIGDAIIGLLLLFAIYLILYQINPNLLNLNVLNDIQPAPASSASQAGGGTTNGAQSSPGSSQ